MSEVKYATKIYASHLFNNPPLKDRQFKATFTHERSFNSDPSPLDDFLARSSQSQQLGIAGAYIPCSSDFLRNGTAGLLTKLAIASPEEVLVITLHFENPDDPGDIVNHTPLYQRFFSEDNPRRFVGFNLDRIALQLFGEYGFSIMDGYDVFSTQVESIDQPRGVRYMPKQMTRLLNLKFLEEMLFDERDQDENGDEEQSNGLLASRAWVRPSGWK